MKKTALLLLLLLTFVALPAQAGAPVPVVRVLASGAPMHGANGLYFDQYDRLHIGSVGGREIIVMDPDSGRILDRIGPERGVDTPDDVTFGPDGSLYWTSIFTGEVGRLKPDGTKATAASGLMGANPITFSDDGRLFVARDFLGNGLYEVDPDGVDAPIPILPDLVGLNGFDFGPDGRLYGPLFTAGAVVSIDVDAAGGDIRTVADGFATPAAVKFNAEGQLFVVDQLGQVTRVDPGSGAKNVFATIESGLDNLAFDSRGRLFVSNANRAGVYQVRPDGTWRIVSRDGFTDVGGLAVLPHPKGESVYAPAVFSVTEFDGATGRVRSFLEARIGASPLLLPQTLAPDGTHLVTSSWFGNAIQVWDPATNTILEQYTDVAVPLNAIRFQNDIVVAELGLSRVLRIAANGTRTELARLFVPTGLAATDQDLWASDWAAGTVVQIVADGVLVSPPAVVASGLAGPEGLAVAPDGSLLVVEAFAGRLSRIALPTGAVTTVAEGLALGSPGPPTMPPHWILDSVAVGPSGAIYVGGDSGNLLYRIDMRP